MTRKNKFEKASFFTKFCVGIAVDKSVGFDLGVGNTVVSGLRFSVGAGVSDGVGVEVGDCWYK